MLLFCIDLCTFRISGVHFPVLPLPRLADIIDAPVPYLVGVVESAIPKRGFPADAVSFSIPSCALAMIVT